MNEFNVSSWRNYNLNQWGGYVIHEVIVTECEKYPSTTILKPVTILSKVINWHDMLLFQIIPIKKRPILNCTCPQWPNQKLVATKFSHPST